MEFWRDKNMDNVIEDIIDIFKNVEGVQLVRLSGLTNRERRIGEMPDLKPENIDGIIRKLKGSGILNYKYIMHCPHCGEVIYQIIDRNIDEAKMCDTCNTFFPLLNGSTLER